MKYMFFICLLYWITLSERFTMESIVAGILITAAVLYSNRDFAVDAAPQRLISLKRIKLWGIYIAVLLKEIVMANFHVAKIVLSRKLNISPGLIKINTGIKSDFNRVIFANSITLTPGTLTILMEKDELLIHFLDKESGEGVKNSEFEKTIMKVEE